jgi:hypothetical protein
MPDPTIAFDRHPFNWTAAWQCRIVANIGVHLPVDYIRLVATDGLARNLKLGVTRLDSQIAVQARSAGDDPLSVILGHPDRRSSVDPSAIQGGQGVE